MFKQSKFKQEVKERLQDQRIEMLKHLVDIRDELGKTISDKMNSAGLRLEESLSDWLEETTRKQKEDQEKSEEIRKMNIKHMNVVEDFLCMQKDILKEIRDCLKILVSPRVKERGKRVTN